jgi:hypothetical protein
MGLRDQLQEALRRLEATPGDSAGLRRLELAVPGGRLVADIRTLDALACAFDHLTLQTDRLADAEPTRLRDIGDDLSQRLTYLLEPIRPVESDAEQGVVQLRSDPPSREEQRGRSYYELLTRRGGSLRLCRFCKHPGQPRQVIPAQVTREVLQRLAQDLVNAVA